MAAFCVSWTKLLPTIYSVCMINNHRVAGSSLAWGASFNQ